MNLSWARATALTFCGPPAGRLYRGEASWIACPYCPGRGWVRRPLTVRTPHEGHTKPTEEDRYFQGCGLPHSRGPLAGTVSARLLESARKAPSSCLQLALEYLYRKEPARAGELVFSALDGAPDTRTRARLLLSLLADRAQGRTAGSSLRMDSVRALMSSSAFLPALEEWHARIVRRRPPK
ncbi:MAG: hypothetical protein ACLT8E_07160 [Akkermansia sp.]